MHTFTRLNVVWNSDMPNETLICMEAILVSTSWPAGSELLKSWLYRSGCSLWRVLTKVYSSLGFPWPMASVSHTLNWAKGMNTQRHHIVPRRLNSRCPMAVRLAATFPLMEARIGVMVVPMLLPSTRAHASSKVIQPLLHIISTMAKVAAELCMMAVTTSPTVENSSMPPRFGVA